MPHWILLTVPTPTGLHVSGSPCFLCLNVPYQSQHLPQDAAQSGILDVGVPTLNVGKCMGSGVQSRLLHLVAHLTVISQKGTLLHYWWECKLVQPQWRTLGRFLKKLKIERSHGPAIPLLGTHLGKNHSLKKIHASQCSLHHYLP